MRSYRSTLVHTGIIDGQIKHAVVTYISDAGWEVEIFRSPLLPWNFDTDALDEVLNRFERERVNWVTRTRRSAQVYKNLPGAKAINYCPSKVVNMKRPKRKKEPLSCYIPVGRY